MRFLHEGAISYFDCNIIYYPNCFRLIISREPYSIALENTKFLKETPLDNVMGTEFFMYLRMSSSKVLPKDLPLFFPAYLVMLKILR